MRTRFIALALSLALASTASAATRREIPGGWYGESQPNGAFAVALKSGPIVTDQGNISAPAPGDRPLYVRLARDGVRFAGQSQNGAGSWEWTGQGWRLDSNPAFGVSGLIYNAADVLTFSSIQFGSQGFRYVEDGTGRIVTGDQTYADPARRIWEWTTHGDVTIGQGAAGCIALRGNDRRTLEPGDCRFVRFNRAGDQLAVTMVKLPEDKTVLLWLSVSELPNFPVEVLTPTPPTPPTPPPTAPEQLQAPNRQSVVAAVKAAHPDIDTCDEESQTKGRAAIVDWAAQRLNKAEGKVIWGRKSRGKPVNGVAVNPNTDGLTYLRTDGRFEIYDVIAGGGSCGATWSDAEPIDQGANGWWAPPQLGAEPTGGTTPTDPTVAELKARIAVLEQELAAIRIQLVATQADRDSAQMRVRALEEERDTLKEQIDGLTITLDQARQEIAKTQDKLNRVGCEAKVPGVLKALGIRVGCKVIVPEQ